MPNQIPNKKLKLLFLGILFFVFFGWAESSWALEINYYIDSGAAEGGNGEMGNPLNQLADINWSAINSDVSGGNTVFINLKKGSEFREMLLVNANGASGRPITIRAYGEGEKPIINAANDLQNGAYRWTASGSKAGEWYLESALGGNPNIGVIPAQIFVSNIPFSEGAAGSLADGRWDWADNDSLGYSTIYIKYGSDPDTAGVEIEASQRESCIELGDDASGGDNVIIDGLELKFSGVNMNGDWSYNADTDNAATLLISDASNVEIKNCYIHDGGSSTQLVLVRRSNHVKIDSCVLADFIKPRPGTGGSVIRFDHNASAQSDYCTISNNTISQAVYISGDGISNAGYITNSTRDGVYGGKYNIFEHNDISGNVENGIYNRTGSNYNVIRYNYIHDTAGICVQLRSNANYNLVYNNLCIDNDGPNIQSDGYTSSSLAIIPHGDLNNKCVGNEIYNNTIYSPPSDDANGIHLFGVNESLIVKNNIVVSGTGDLLQLGANGDNTSDWTVNNNLFFKPSATGPEFIFRGTGYATLASFQSAISAAGESSEQLSEWGNPIFANTSSPYSVAGFTLDASSPGRDSGSSVVVANSYWPNFSDDYSGVSRPQGSAWDIGAYEFVSEGDTTPPAAPSNLSVQ